MTNEDLRLLLKKHNLPAIRIAQHFKIPKQQVYAWINNRHAVGKAWQRLLTGYFDNLGK